MAEPDRAAESRKTSARAKVEHPFLIVKRVFGFTETRYRGIGKNLHLLHMLFACATWLMRARAVALTGAAAWRRPARNRPPGPRPGPGGRHRAPPDAIPTALTASSTAAHTGKANGSVVP